jgi:hypothetical protein
MELNVIVDQVVKFSGAEVGSQGDKRNVTRGGR